MNKLTKKVLAAIAAAVMTVTAAGPSVYANVSYDTIANGWVKEGNTERRYEDGFPYTGWLLVEDGTKKYCLDGYLVTGNFTMDGRIYKFDEDGIYRGKNSVPDLSAECGEVNPDTNRIDFTVYVNKDDGYDGLSYAVAEPVKMQRWSKGKWVDCKGKDVSYGHNEPVSALIGYNYSGVLSFYPQAYTNNNFKEGYYRVVFSASDAADKKASAKKFYSVFKVSPRNIYKDGLVAEGSFTRRYSKGEPYTGWSQAKNGLRKYYLDGYLMKGDMQIDNYIYTFNDEGECINKTYKTLSASCGEKVAANTETLTVNIYSELIGSNSFFVSDPVVLMHWEYGRWVGCKGNGVQYQTDPRGNVINSLNSKVYFYPQKYTNNRFNTGYYKLDLTASGTGSGVIEGFSTMFEVVPYTVVKNGWVKEGNTERRYKDGRPYTGWVTSKTGQKYCFDGYVVTGNFQIGKYNYYFTADGIYTGIKTKLAVTADCGNAVASNSQTLVITVKNTGADGRDHSIGQPYKMERWENGKWVICKGSGVQYTVPSSSSVIYAKSGKNTSNYTTMNFYPQTYTGGSFTPGYYRIEFFGWEQGMSGASAESAIAVQEIYAMFEVV